MTPDQPILLTEAQWADIHHRLAREYADRPSVMIIRSAMRQELGFTVRRYRSEPYQDARYQETKICLDFYDDVKKTLFVLKYL